MEGLELKVCKESMELYAVTDSTWLGNHSLAEQVEQCIQGGVTFVQLREKDKYFLDFVRLARAIKKVTDKYQVPFIINDNIDVAIACGADGVHVGQNDMEVSAVRGKIGEDMILGVSAQTVSQALHAEKMGADYIGVGAVFSTSTKLDADAVSFEILKSICDAVSIPVVAIGGISKKNMMDLKGSGIAGVAVVSAIFAQDNIYEETKLLKALAGSLLHKDSVQNS